MSQVVKLGSFVFYTLVIKCMCISVLLYFDFFTFFQIPLSQWQFVGIFVPLVY